MSATETMQNIERILSKHDAKDVNSRIGLSPDRVRELLSGGRVRLPVTTNTTNGTKKETSMKTKTEMKWVELQPATSPDRLLSGMDARLMQPGGKKGRTRKLIKLSGATIKALGLKPKGRAAVAHDTGSYAIRLTPTEAGGFYLYACPTKADALRCYVDIPIPQGWENVDSVSYRLDGGFLMPMESATKARGSE